MKTVSKLLDLPQAKQSKYCTLKNVAAFLTTFTPGKFYPIKILWNFQLEVWIDNLFSILIGQGLMSCLS